MEKPRQICAPVMLKGLNYLLWSRTMRTTLCSHDLWSHIEEEDADDNQEGMVVDGRKWFRDDQMVLGIIQSSLEPSLLEAYSYCETAKELWCTLYNVFGNASNLSRVYQVKKAINDLKQDEAFTKHFGKFRSLWAELEMLRPHTMDQSVILERREQDKVFGLLLTLDQSYGDLVKHLLRADKLPSLEEVCAHIQKEEGSIGLFGGKEKGDLVIANKAEANKGVFKHEDKKHLACDHCKKKGHTKEKCWILHPHLKPNKWKDQPKAHYSQELSHPKDYPQSQPNSPYQGGSSSHQGNSQYHQEEEGWGGQGKESRNGRSSRDEFVK